MQEPDRTELVLRNAIRTSKIVRLGTAAGVIIHTAIPQIAEYTVNFFLRERFVGRHAFKYAPVYLSARGAADCMQQEEFRLYTFTGESPIRSLMTPEHELTNKLDILIVDDSAAIRKILQRVLLQAGVCLGKVIEAGDGVEALEKLKVEKVSLVLSDINMPNMDGLELLRRIRADETYKLLPVVMVTTEASQNKVLQAVQLGANGYVRKPFSAQEIKAKLDGIC